MVVVVLDSEVVVVVVSVDSVVTVLPDVVVVD